LSMLLACVNLFSVVMAIASHATMRFAPDLPKNGRSLEDLFLDQVRRRGQFIAQSNAHYTSQPFDLSHSFCHI
jgi:hypothetical protein